MHRAVLAASLLALAGCQPAGRPLAQQQPPAYAYGAQPSQPPVEAQVPTVADRQGRRAVERFRGPFDGGTASVTLTPQAGDRTALRLATRSQLGCAEDGTRAVSTQALNGAGVVVPGNGASEGVLLRRTPGGLSMEQKGTGYSRCFFTGDLSRF